MFVVELESGQAPTKFGCVASSSLRFWFRSVQFLSQSLDLQIGFVYAVVSVARSLGAGVRAKVSCSFWRSVSFASNVSAFYGPSRAVCVQVVMRRSILMVSEVQSIESHRPVAVN